MDLKEEKTDMNKVTEKKPESVQPPKKEDESLFTPHHNAKTYTEKKRLTFLGLPWTFTTYHINEEKITVDSGFFKKVENDCYLYKVLDVRYEQTVFQRLAGLGTIHCFGADVTNPELVMKNIRNAQEIKDFIFHESEEERMKRKTINTQNIGMHPGMAQAAQFDSCDR